MNVVLTQSWRTLRDFDWLTPERAKAYSRILFGMTMLIAALWIGLAKHGLDHENKPIGTDFVGFWTASQLALAGTAGLAYDVGAHWQAQKALFGPAVAYTAFFYPPPYLLVCLPLAAAPYFWSLAIWLAVTFVGYWRVIRAYLPEDFDPVAALAFPAILINAGHGQNGFLTAALIGGGLAAMRRRPVLAGLCFGAMAFKPQLALMIPVALIAARRWTSLCVAAATAAAFLAASWLAFGAKAWNGFLAAAPYARAALEQNLIGDDKMQSVFAAVRMAHGGLGLAYGLQIATAFSAAAALALLQRRAFRSDAEAPAAAAACLAASPFLLDYDLCLLAIPLAWLFSEGRRAGFLPGEKALMTLAFLLPLVSRVVAETVHLPLGGATILAVLALVVRRGLARPARIGDRAPLEAANSFAQTSPLAPKG